MKRYYLEEIGTIYDGLKFNTFRQTLEKDIPLGKELDRKKTEKEAIKNWIHEGTGEELDNYDINEIPKADYNVLRKYHI